MELPRPAAHGKSFCPDFKTSERDEAPMASSNEHRSLMG